MMMKKPTKILGEVVFFYYYYYYEGKIEIRYRCLNGRGSYRHGLDDVVYICGGEAKREGEALLS